MSSGALWCCPRPRDFSLAEWPDAGVLFDEASGNIHCLNAAASELASLVLKGQAASASELTEALLGESPEQEDVELVENVLEQFLVLELVERQAC